MPNRHRSRPRALAETTLVVDGLDVHATRKTIRNLYLRIRPADGSIEVSAPARMSDERIADFVRERRSWIERQQQRLAAARRNTLAQSGVDVAILGSVGAQSSLGVQHDAGGVDAAAGAHNRGFSDVRAGTDNAWNDADGIGNCRLAGAGTGVIATSDGRTDANEGVTRRSQGIDGIKCSDAGDIGIGAGINKGTDIGTNANSTELTPFIWTAARKQQAANAINSQLPGLLAHWELIIGRSPSHITLRLMSSRWGSCTPRTGRIRLNLQLGLMDKRFLNYVLVHEMTHLWASGHGADFQRHMDRYLPNWRQLRRELNRQVVL